MQPGTDQSIRQRRERHFKTVWLGIALCLCSVWSSCGKHPAPNSDAQNMDSSASEVRTSKYVSGSDITDQLLNDLTSGLDVYLPAGHYCMSSDLFAQLGVDVKRYFSIFPC